MAQPEQLQYSLIAKAPMPILFLAGPTLKVEYLNQRALELLSEPHQTVIGKEITQVFPEAFPAQDVSLIVEKCLQQRQSLRLRQKPVAMVGQPQLQIAWFDIDCQFVEGDRDNPGIVCYFTDASCEKIYPSTPESRYDYLNNFFKAAPVGIVCYRSEDFIVDLANDQALAIWGKTLDEVKGKPIVEIFPEVISDPVISQRHKESVERMKRGERHVVNEVELSFMAEGKLRSGWYSYIHEPYTNDSGEIVGMMAIALDVTEQKTVEEKLKELNQNLEKKIAERTSALSTLNDILSERNTELNEAYAVLQQLIDSSPEYIAVLDVDLKFLVVNKGFADFINQSPANLIGRNVFEVYAPAQSSQYAGLLQKVLRGESIHLRANPALSQPNVWFDSHFVPLVIDNKIEGVISLSRDISDIIKHERDLADVNRQLQEAQHLAKLGSWEWNMESGQIIWSDEMYRLYGYEEKFEVDFARATERMSHEEAENSRLRTQRHIEEAIKNYESSGQRVYEFSTIEYSITTPSGDTKLLRSSGKVHLTEDGKRQRILGAVQDITEIRSAEEKLRLLYNELQQNTELLDSILRYSSNGISVSELIFDESGNVIDAQTILANDAAVKYIGLPKEEYLSKRATYFDPNIIASPYGQSCINTLKTGEPFIMRYFLEFSQRWLELTVSKMDESHLIHHFTDVTSMREAELKLQNTLEELEYSNANLEEFAYAASHDLKEPIRKAQFYTNRLKEDLRSNLSEEQRSLFDRLEVSQTRMHTLIVDLLEYSQAAKGTADRQEIDLNVEIKSVLEDLELEVQKKLAEVRAGKLPTIIGNKRQIHQLFQNLISNALKYNKVGVPPEISIEHEIVFGKDVSQDLHSHDRDKRFHLITVKDNGIGFEKMYADKIFKVFTRLHSHEQYSGTGIGLSIVKKVVESHHGFVWAESEPGNGSTFKILLPVV